MVVISKHLVATQRIELEMALSLSVDVDQPVDNQFGATLVIKEPLRQLGRKRKTIFFLLVIRRIMTGRIQS